MINLHGANLNVPYIEQKYPLSMIQNSILMAIRNGWSNYEYPVELGYVDVWSLMLGRRHSLNTWCQP